MAVATDPPVISVAGPSPVAAQEWFPLLQVIHGVLLSASVGAFAAGGIPPLLRGEASRTNVPGLWTCLAVATIIVSFDTWYQYGVNGRYLFSSEAPQWTGVTVMALIAAIVWTSFLPFQFVIRTQDQHSWKFLKHEPANTIFWLCLCITLLVQVLFIGVVALRGERVERPAVPGRPSETVELGKIPLFIGLIRALSLAVIVIYGSHLLHGGQSPQVDSIAHLVIIMAIFGIFRLVETGIAFGMARNKKKGSAGVA